VAERRQAVPDGRGEHEGYGTWLNIPSKVAQVAAVRAVAREGRAADLADNWLVRAKPHVIGPMRTSFVTGLETWFTLPGQPGAPPPPPYKMALLTWITIFPLITAIVALTGPLLESLPVAVRLAITTALTVPLMTWVVMPRVTRLLRGWLYPGR
jgi:antibiotic biosynthesis monooxygenase (ABM) superfamily enzyme